MLSTLLLTTAVLAPSGEADNLSPRLIAATELRSQLAGLEGHDDCAHRMPILVSAGDAAAAALGENAFADELRDLVYEARWRAIAKPGPAESRLERDLKIALTDLEFEPLIEADLPEGFPTPTPVREVELKTYPVYRIARADMKGGSDNGAFWQLFQHIKKNDIPMTAPVEMTYDESGDEIDMAFMYEYAAQGSAGPDGSVDVMNIEPMLVASLGCRGRSSDAAVEDAREQLTRWIASRADLEVAGPLRQFGYNSPMVPNSRRYFEVQIPVRKVGDERPPEIVIDFSNKNESWRWAPIDDSVMGGVSASRLVSSGDGSCVFAGDLSLENNGGFASVRSAKAELGLEGSKGLSVKVRGDGKTYKLRLRMDGRMDGVSYEVSFPTTAGEWTEESFDLSEFRPTWRGRNVPNADDLDPSRVRSVTFMISDKQEGSFRLELASLSKF